jgi:hypothetical protein
MTSLIQSISPASNIFQAHWRKAQVLRDMTRFEEAFNAFIAGFEQSDVSDEVKNTFLAEAANTLAQNITG